jgi:cell wall assembly regulator SMI1
MDLNEILSEFAKYTSSICKLYQPALEQEINEFEEKLKYKLPLDFKEFLLISNGAKIDCQTLYGLSPDKPGIDLYDNYIFETVKAGNPMYDSLLPILPDGMGNHNCLDLKSISDDGKICNVIFWQHDILYGDNNMPDTDASSFSEFLETLLNEIAKQYNYDGSEK